VTCWLILVEEMKLISEALQQGHVALDLEASNFPTAVRLTVKRMVDDGLLPDSLESAVVENLLEHEQVYPTAIGHAVAVPHAYLDGLDGQVIQLVRLVEPINLGAPDGVPTQFLFFLLGPTGAASRHIDSVANIARLFSDEEFRYEAGEAASADDLLVALQRSIGRTETGEMVRPAISESLAYTGKLAGGIVLDIKRRWPHYLDDFREGFHPKCLGSTMFLFFACLAPAVTFGGLMAVETNNQIGAVEMILASAICGIIYAVFSGTPLIILGGTGPLLIFTAVLYRLCLDYEIEFLPTYAWVGLWSAALLVLLAVTDASSLMRFFTRFTDEIFAALISLIFIYEAVDKLGRVFVDLDSGGNASENLAAALLSLVLALGTFYVAMSLSRFRRSSFLLPKVREFLADFGPAIAMIMMTMVAMVAVNVHSVPLDALKAPDEFGPTTDRSWSIDLLATPMWARFAALGPALLVTVLVYLDQNITARIVNSPDHHLHKGDSYHLDLGLVGVLMAICSLIGLPWLVAATVRSLNHVRSLATLETVVGPGNETRSQVIHVRENRVTGLMIHLLLGLSLFLLPLLSNIPMAVLYGLFLFMGVVSIGGNQFFERLSLWLKDPKLYPSMHYIRRVERKRIHLFTLLQLSCLVVLWIVKVSKISAIAIMFPVVIALMVPARLLSARFFTAEELAALDAEEEPEEEETHWA